MIDVKRLRVPLSPIGLAVAALCSPWSAAHAQSAASPAGEDAGALEEIVVTGSRIARRDYTSASPIVTATQSAIEDTGQVNLEQALQQLPQFLGGRDSTVTGLGGNGYSTLNLRGLGDNRNLILLDGHRLPIASSTGATDINIIPGSLIGSVEVISGGASAVYGSDAISGVVNFKTRSLDGIEIAGQGNLSEMGDARVRNLSLSAGGKYAQGRGKYFATANYTDRSLVFYKARDFFARAGSSGSQATGAVQFVGGAPSRASLDTVFGAYGVAPGTVATNSRFGFNSDGTLYSVTGGYNFKESLEDYGLVSNQIVGFTGRENYLISPQERYNVFGKTDFALNDRVTLYGQGLYMQSTITTSSAWAITAPTQPSVPVTNPFIPSGLRTLLDSRPAAVRNNPVLLFKGYQELGRRTYEEDYEVYQVGAGVRARLASDWTLDVFGSYDDTNLHERINHVVLYPRVQVLLNAADGGNSICAGGYNPFGLAASAAISDACRSYLTAPTDTQMGLSQKVFEATVQGTAFSMPAGPAKVSLTADWRENQFELNPDILLIPNYDYTGTAFNDIAGARYPNSPASATNTIFPAAGKVSVKELAGEFLLPLVTDASFARSLNLTLGARISDYNLAGSAFTYKAELDWRPVESLLLRGGFEHALRAPNVAELFSQSGTVVAVGNPPAAGDPCDSRSSLRTGANAANVQRLCLAQFQAAGLTATEAANLYPGYTYISSVVGSRITGNPRLDPESADTYTIGAVYTLAPFGDWFRRASLSVDYYNIEIKDQISTLTGSLALQKCFNLDGSNPTYDPSNSYCSTIVRSAGSGILFDIGAPYLNLAGTRTSGIDVQFDSEFNLPRGLRLGFNTVVNYLDEFKIQALAGSPWQEYRATISGGRATTPPLPGWRSASTLNLMYGDASGSLRWRHIHSMRDVASVTSATPPAGVDAYDILDLSARMKIGERLELSGGINNLLDKDPLVVGGIDGQTTPTLYDVIGRNYFLGFKARF